MPEPRMLTEEELIACLGCGNFGRVSITYNSGPYEVTTLTHNAAAILGRVQRKLMEVNGIAGARKEWCPECNEAICPGCAAASLAEGEAN